MRIHQGAMTLAEKNAYRCLLFCIGIYGISAISAIIGGISSYDEETDYHGITSQVVHAALSLKGESPNFRDIYTNTEFYGIAPRLIGWLFFALHRSFLFGESSISRIASGQNVSWETTGYIQYSHLLNIFIFALGAVFVFKIARLIRGDLWTLPSIAASLYLLFPVLAGHSFMNTKDIPVAVIYTAFTYFLGKLLLEFRPKYIFFSAFCAGLLVSAKIVFFVPILITYFVLYLLSRIQEAPPSYRDGVRTLALLIVLTLLAWYVLTPAAWLEPFVYIKEAFSLFSDFREGGGCTSILGRSHCLIGADRAEILEYVFLWFFVHVTPLVFVGLIIFAVDLLQETRSIFRASSVFSCRYQLVILLLLQSLLVPAMAVLGKSVLYDGDRHLLFAYPPLLILSSIGVSICLQSKPYIRPFVVSLALMQAVNFLLLNPYQYVYLNPFARLFASSENTSLDYWGVSAREALQSAVLDGSISMDTTFSGGPYGLANTPTLAHALKSMGGRVRKENQYSSPNLVHVFGDGDYWANWMQRNAGTFECTKVSSVRRKQILFPKLELSSLHVCKRF